MILRPYFYMDQPKPRRPDLYSLTLYPLTNSRAMTDDWTDCLRAPPFTTAWHPGPEALVKRKRVQRRLLEDEQPNVAIQPKQVCDCCKMQRFLVP